MVHKTPPRTLWQNTVSSWQFGIYKERPRIPAVKSSASRRLRYCVLAAMSTVVALLVSMMIYDAAKGRGDPARDKELVQKLLLLQSSTTGSTPQLTGSAVPVTSDVTTSTPSTSPEAFSSPLLEDAPTELPQTQRSGGFFDDHTEEPSTEELRAPRDGFLLTPNAHRRSSGQQQPRPFLKARQRSRGKQQPPSHFNLGTQTRPYAQLGNYRYPNNAKNIQDIIKYLTDDMNKMSQKQIQSIPFGRPNKPKKAVKFSGVYLNPQIENDDEDDDEDSSNDKYMIGEMMMPNQRHNYDEPSKSLNGHAYISDPFHAYKPADPSEVNLLANSDFRFAPSDSNIPFSDHKGDHRHSPSDKFFPRPPINFSKPSSTPATLSDNDNQMNKYPGTYTAAIYRPFGKEPLATTDRSKTGRKRGSRPFSVMLDIYPMTEEETRKVPPMGHGGPGSLRQKPTNNVVHRLKLPQESDNQQHKDENDSRHQMIVHLNVYPRKKKASSRSDSVDIPSFHVSVRGADLSRVWQAHGQCDDRDDYLEDTVEEEEDRNASEEEYFPTETPESHDSTEEMSEHETPSRDDSWPQYSDVDFVNSTRPDPDVDLLSLEAGPFLVPSGSFLSTNTSEYPSVLS